MRYWILFTLLLASPLEDARQLAAQGRHVEAVALFDEAIAKDGKSAEAHAGKGASLLALGRNEEAMGAIEKAIELRPGEVGFEMMAGRVLVAKGDVEGARRRYERSAKGSPTKAGVVYADLAGALSGKNDPKWSSAIDAAFQAAANAEPPHLDSLFHLGQSHVAAGKPEGRAYLVRYLEAAGKLPEKERDARKIQLAKQMIRAVDILKATK